MLAQQISAEHRQRAVATLHDFGAADLAEIPLGKMSTGQQRRCLLARAMVHNPDTLILDEPTAGLDLTASFELMARIGRLISAGRNIVLVTHLLNEIPPAIERVVLLRAGEVVADGPKQAVLNERDLSETYSTPIRVSEVDGYYLATPG